MPLRGLLTALAIAAAAAGLALGVGTLGALGRAEGDSVDARFGLRGVRPAPEVAVVGIDDRALGAAEPWPFKRRRHARAIEHLHAAGARLIAYDVQFTEPTTARDDGALLDAVDRARPVVLATTEVDERGRTNVLGGVETQREVGARVGNALLPVDAGEVFRRMRAGTQGIPSFAHLAARTAGAPPAGDVLIDFHGPPGTIETLSFADVESGRFDPARVRGRVVVVGAVAPSLQDVHAAPTSGDALMAGPEIQANAISTLLRGAPLRTTSTWPAVLALALVAPLLALVLPVWALVVATAAAAAGYAALAQAAFGTGLVLPVVAPGLALVLAFLGALVHRVSSERRERRRTRELFGRYVPEAVVGQLLARGDGSTRLPAQRLDATVLFCDLRGFTTFAERQPPERVLELLNHYLGEMSDAILAHGGTVVSYMGDGIMAVFGSPLPSPDHADAALAASREMLEVRLPRFNAQVTEHGLPPFRLGIGLNSGPVMSGTVGSERRLEYAALGDTTNVAARLEAMTKGSESDLLLSEATRSRLSLPPGDLVPAGELAVRNREEPVEVFGLAAAGATRPVPAR